MTTTINFHFTDTLEKRRQQLTQAGATSRNTTLSIRHQKVQWTGEEDADLAVANGALVSSTNQ
jgi:hypothetical protein